MARTISDLITAAFAGEALTAPDLRRLARYFHHTDRIDRILMRGVSQGDITRSKRMTLAEGFAEQRRTLLRNLRTYTVDELRGHVRQLLVLLGMFVELAAGQEGTKRRQRRHRTHGVEQAALARREALAELRQEVARIKATHPSLTTRRAVAKQYLQDEDPDWDALSHDQRERKIDSLTRRLRRKKSGHS
jgi:hypothetical protein